MAAMQAEAHCGIPLQIRAAVKLSCAMFQSTTGVAAPTSRLAGAQKISSHPPHL